MLQIYLHQHQKGRVICKSVQFDVAGFSLVLYKVNLPNCILKGNVLLNINILVTSMSLFLFCVVAVVVVFSYNDLLPLFVCLYVFK